MIKKCSYFIGIIGTLILSLTAFKSYETQSENISYYAVDSLLPVRVMTEDEWSNIQSMANEQELFDMELSKCFVDFKERLAFRESQCDYGIVNTLGYMGKYQFGKSTLNFLGIKDTKKFLKDPALQEKAFVKLLAYNKYVLQRDLKRYVGKRVGGVWITESGVLAAAHLGGAGAVQAFLRSNGTTNFSDAYGTSITEYMKQFAAYDVSQIKPEKNPRIMS